MKEKLLEFAKHGAMSKAELAGVLKCKVSAVDRLIRRKILQTIPHLKPQRIDPLHAIDVFCGDSKQVRSLTSDKRKTSGNPKSGGFRKCL